MRFIAAALGALPRAAPGTAENAPPRVQIVTSDVEGAAEFVAEQISGSVAATHLHRWAAGREGREDHLPRRKALQGE